jgi:hypothetical protein
MSRKVNRLLAEFYDLTLEIQRIQNVLTKKQARANMLCEVDIPEAMTEIGSYKHAADDGSNLTCTVETKMYGSLPSKDDPERRYAAIDYLKENDGAELVKSKVIIEYDKGDIRGANKMFRFLTKSLPELKKRNSWELDLNHPILVDSDVHHSSLAAWGRQRVKDNLPTDLGLVGLRSRTVATVKKVEK